ncbi:glycosyltransferase family 39 protein [Alteribacillus bidgolensis]|uniref:Dolichyl-phosphate-mannose-protein mannosyltransferase n=1 Tax=Alteribacillus bidgolensis TaxID=930129 RepID=A0A1G8NFT0_9BACI|nr:glycosyltransferase family 39 protein [Alteribacillus bidgolensis]SDI79018.1 Dolichyl-phosphate-mannose-protein mannosyltransferase [Alteribacillus bidgolensis]
MKEKQLTITQAKEKEGTFILRKSDWIISFSLFLFALLVRIPYMYDVPRFIDEWREVELSAQIARGEIWPLHNTSHDIGAFHNYVLAGLFKLFGYSVYLPRLYVVLLSAGTVVVSYWIARHWFGRLHAMIAASLLATNSMHIFVTHMAWANVTTPFFVSLAVLVTLKTIGQKRRSLWALAGLTWAIALQTHPSVIAALLGVVFYVITHSGWRAFYRESGYRIAIVVFIAGYSNMIIHNIIKPLDSFLWVKRKDYALNQEFSIGGYIENILEMIMELIRSLSSTFPDGEGWLHGISFLIMILFIIGLTHGFRRLMRFRHGSLLLAIVIASLLVIPILNDQYEFYLWTRYIAYLFPLCLVAIAVGFGDWIQPWIGRRDKHKQRNIKRGTVILAAWAVILILPLYYLHSYAESYIQSGRDNSAEFLAFRTLKSEHQKQSIIAVDKQGKQAEALSKMFRVKGFNSPLVGIDPNESLEAQEVPSNWEEEKDFTFYTRWEKVFMKDTPDTWYVLSMDTKDKLTLIFGITWKDVKTIQGKGGHLTYFICRIDSMEY